MVGSFLGISAAAIALLAWVDPASAFCFPASACQAAAPQPAPGPLIGFGLPIAGAALAALLAVRHFRQKD
jgi:hypothetical protein